jgi:hypothetical protein
MKRNRKFAVAMMVSATWFGFANAPADAQTTAPGPYYATPSWDQQLPGTTRFVVLSNWVDFDFPSGGAAVLDRETGLVWQRKVGRFESWQFALADCFDATTGNRFGWRLPANYEAATLFEASTSAIPAGHPFIGVPSAPTQIWTRTPADGSPDRRYVVLLQPGGGITLHFAALDSTLGYQWCVRGPGLQ